MFITYIEPCTGCKCWHNIAISACTAPLQLASVALSHLQRKVNILAFCNLPVQYRYALKFCPCIMSALLLLLINCLGANIILISNCLRPFNFDIIVYYIELRILCYDLRFDMPSSSSLPPPSPSLPSPPVATWELVNAGEGLNQYHPLQPHARSLHAGTPVSADTFTLFGGCAR